ncbi:bifunctional adenosylcobinamide kinase/adenosylcobinamide-phosphate guanylyltransferase [Ureibacillus aquaedulcis]|uniref:Bifunctional adenosylcobinamide kinase/adenosylcobinamide-phosphate guanylyltransferase n=1 Tax=Ureibacillus aquaedulcis TaxID=3058421 RepID=A0ABT8GPC7_9BACL|nr:bifunctional adenosylcobinamide kinase/adenosylcobinamide-phosphate guanylyltransferase [Ureibacillus sp. BA0131]MDN4493262.1 bifunctional adenosylcobinamide kinase/adenosylcobinamide-phosphate guanylyltransferase [Ureibacillus sp. BA0131]
MQIVIGGAYNGKRKFVKDRLANQLSGNYYFFEGIIPNETKFYKEDVIIIGDFEKIILQKIHLDEEAIAEEIFNNLYRLNQQVQVICICTDIGRGIVPLLKEERKLRDACGRLYQKLFSESESVVRVWYGIPQVLKGGGL